MLLTLLPLVATAAEVTTMPDALGGSATVRYSGVTGFGDLDERDQAIARRRSLSHDLDLGLELSPIDGVALTVGLSLTPGWSLRFPEARKMLPEPVEGGGSYLDGPEAAAPDLRGSGMNGVWFGAAFAPFSEAFANPQRFTWRLDAGIRTGTKKTRWSVVDGKRGAGPGGTAIRLGGAFSRTGGVAEPYVQGVWVKEGKVTTDIVDESGTTWATGVELRPASTVDLVGGTEIIVSENGPSRTSVDVAFGFGYRSWEDIPSGLLLPNVLDASRAIAVTHSEAVHGSAKLGINIRYTKNLRSTAGANVAYEMPHTQEHVYAVKTSADSYAIGWYLAVTGTLGQADFGD